MAVDLKVLVRSFNCESRACYVGNHRESLFSSSRKIFLFAKASRKLDIMNHYHCIHLQLVKGYHLLCRPEVRQENGYCSIGNSQASEGEPNTMLLKHIFAIAAGAA